MNAYTKAGVDVQAGYESVKRIKKQLAKTVRPEMLAGIGGFGGAFDLSESRLVEPVLVAGTDGVGTKLLIASEQGKHTTIGIDCVAMCVNDILAQGAAPLFFLDYIATGTVEPSVIEEIVTGVAAGCVAAKAGLIGGETAEMPDMYAAKHYDLAGFAVGLVEKKQLLTPEKVCPGDVLIGLPASGLHSNGYSLVRQIFFKDHALTYDTLLEELAGKTLGEELLTPTRIYVEAVQPLLTAQLVHGIAHITGGGFVENIPRMLPENLMARIKLGSWPVLPIFDSLQKYGQLGEREMYEIFNMGIGFVLAVAPADVSRVQQCLQEQGEASHIIGQVEVSTGEAIVLEPAVGDEVAPCDWQF